MKKIKKISLAIVPAIATATALPLVTISCHKDPEETPKSHTETELNSLLEKIKVTLLDKNLTTDEVIVKGKDAFKFTDVDTKVNFEVVSIKKGANANEVELTLKVVDKQNKDKMSKEKTFTFKLETKENLDDLLEKIEVELIDKSLTLDEVIAKGQSAFKFTVVDPKVEVEVVSIEKGSSETEVKLTIKVVNKINNTKMSKEKSFAFPVLESLDSLLEKVQVTLKNNLYSSEVVSQGKDAFEFANVDARVNCEVASLEENADKTGVILKIKVVDKKDSNKFSKEKTFEIKTLLTPDMVLNQVKAEYPDHLNVFVTDADINKIVYSNFDQNTFEIVESKILSKFNSTLKFEFKIKNKIRNEVSTNKRTVQINGFKLTDKYLNYQLGNIEIYSDGSKTLKETKTELLNPNTTTYKTVFINNLPSTIKIVFESVEVYKENADQLEIKFHLTNIHNENNKSNTRTEYIYHKSDHYDALVQEFEKAKLSYEGGTNKVNAFDILESKIKIEGLKTPSDFSDFVFKFTNSSPSSAEYKSGKRKIDFSFVYKGNKFFKSEYELQVKPTTNEIIKSLKKLNTIKLVQTTEALNKLESLADGTTLDAFNKSISIDGVKLFSYNFTAYLFSEDDDTAAKKVLLNKDNENYYLSFYLGGIVYGKYVRHYEESSAIVAKIQTPAELTAMLNSKINEFDYKNKTTTEAKNAVQENIVSPDFGSGYSVKISDFTTLNDKITFNVQLSNSKHPDVFSDKVLITISGFYRSELAEEIANMEVTIADSFKAKEAKEFTDVNNITITDKRTSTAYDFAAKGISLETTIVEVKNLEGIIKFNLKFTKGTEVVNKEYIIDGFKKEALTAEKIISLLNIQLIKENVQLDKKYFLSSYITKDEVSITNLDDVKKINSTINVVINKTTPNVAEGKLDVELNISFDSNSETKTISFDGFNKNVKTSTENMVFKDKMKLIVYLAKNNILFKQVDQNTINGMNVVGLSGMTTSIKQGLTKYGFNPMTMENDFNFEYVFSFVATDTETVQDEKFDTLIRHHIVGNKYNKDHTMSRHIKVSRINGDTQLAASFRIVARDRVKFDLTKYEYKTAVGDDDEYKVFTWILGNI